MIYLQLFLAFFIPGIIGYGGGPAAIPLVEYEVVAHFNFVTQEEFAQIVAVQSSLPGVTATKIAGYIGFQEAGVLGSIIAVAGFIMPSILLMIILLGLLKKFKSSPVVKRITNYVRPAIIVLLGSLTYRYMSDSYETVKLLPTIILMFVSLVLLQKFKLHPIYVIILAMTYGALSTFII